MEASSQELVLAAHLALLLMRACFSFLWSSARSNIHPIVTCEDNCRPFLLAWQLLFHISFHCRMGRFVLDLSQKNEYPGFELPPGPRRRYARALGPHCSSNKNSLATSALSGSPASSFGEAPSPSFDITAFLDFYLMKICTDHYHFAGASGLAFPGVPTDFCFTSMCVITYISPRPQAV